VGEVSLNELSGLVASRAQPGVLFVHADSGAVPRFLAIDTTGKQLGAYTLANAASTDWEDVSLGPGPDGKAYLFFADIGDNGVRDGTTPRAQIQVYRVPEPSVSLSQSSQNVTLSDWDVLRFVYPDAPHDAETLMIDPVTSDLVIVTRELDGNSSVFRAPANTPVNSESALQKVTNIQFGTSGKAATATAGDFSPNGDRVLIRTYTAVLLWQRAATLAATFAIKPLALPSATEPQGEALGFSADGESWFSAGELSDSLYQAKSTCR
jgi:hypothetical protein